MKDKKILIADVTGRQVTVNLPSAVTVSLNKDAEPDLFTPFRQVYLTGFVESLSSEMVRVKDFINASGYNPLMGKNRDDLGPRFPDMSYVFCPLASKHLPEVVVTAGEIEDPEADNTFIRCDAMVWNAILAAHQKKKVSGILYGNLDALIRLINEELRIIKG